MSLAQKNAIVIFDHSQQSPESLSEAIADIGFESNPSESGTATPVSADTQLIPASNLTPTAQREALKKLSQIQGVLDVREIPAQTSLSVSFVPSLTSVQQLNEVVATITAMEIPTPSSPVQKGPNLSPSHSTRGGVALKLTIEGMTCHSCTTTIEGKIGKLKGVERIKGNVFHPSTHYITSRLNVVHVFVHARLIKVIFG